MKRETLGAVVLVALATAALGCAAPAATSGEAAASPAATGASSAPATPAAAGSAGATAEGASACTFPKLPDEAAAQLAASKMAFSLQATGVQVYRCDVTATGAAWSLVGPDATLAEPSGAIAGKHYVGPTWEGADGSKVVGAKVASVSVDASSIPWLLLEAKSHDGAGRMAKVNYVERVQTSGGVAPAAGCDEAHRGQTVRIDYKATYSFCEPKQ